MRTILLLLCLPALLLLSCSKSADSSDPGQDKTTVNFSNTLSRNFDNVMIGKWTGGQASLIKSVGSLQAGSSTGEIELKDPSLVKVYFYYEENGKVYMSPYGFTIEQGTFNNWNLDGNLVVDEIKKTDIWYPK